MVGEGFNKPYRLVLDKAGWSAVAEHGSHTFHCSSDCVAFFCISALQLVLSTTKW